MTTQRKPIGQSLDELPLRTSLALGSCVGGLFGAVVAVQEGVWPIIALAGAAGLAIPLARSGKPVAELARSEPPKVEPSPDPPEESPKSTGGKPSIAPPEAASKPLPLLDMVPIPAGTFWMGSADDDEMAFPNERPRHRVGISGFELARVPVTQAQYREIMGAHDTRFHGDDLPVTNVNWFDAVRFCNALSKREGLEFAYQIAYQIEEPDDHPVVVWNSAADGYRLPTEAEWEYAARGEDGRRYPWGNDPPQDQLCWNGTGNDRGRESRRGPCLVGSYRHGASPFGILDMSGNVAEWCHDGLRRYGAADERPENSIKNPTWLVFADTRVVRGGSWRMSDPRDFRATCRDKIDVTVRDVVIGFRCARGAQKR